MLVAKSSSTRVALDTNIWSRLGDEGAGPDFEKLVSDLKCTVIVPPSTLLEILRLPVPEPRARIVDTLTSGRRVRLPSEAELESAEVVQEVRRCRPNWLRTFPITGRTATYHTYWTKKVWREAKQNPEALHSYLLQNNAGKVAHLLSTQKENRRAAITDNFDYNDLSHLRVSTNDPATLARVPGWDGSPIEGWRFELFGLYWSELRSVYGRSLVTRGDATYADWVGAYIDLPAMTRDAADFVKFWFEDVEKGGLKRNWLRWAVHQAQTATKITDGNPIDAQHAAYHLDYDLYLTADRRYANVLDNVRKHCDFPVAETRLVSGDRTLSITDRICQALNHDATT